VENVPVKVSVFSRNASDNQDDFFHEMEVNDWDRVQRGKFYISKSLFRASSKLCTTCGTKYAIEIRRLDT
jgi:hypothetical protein